MNGHLELFREFIRFGVAGHPYWHTLERKYTDKENAYPGLTLLLSDDLDLVKVLLHHLLKESSN